MAIVSGGIGSGLDVNSIITQLMALERRPITQLQQSKQTVNSQISAYGKIQSDLSAFQTALADLKKTETFDLFKATSSSTSTLTASATTGASAAAHSVVVNTLAAAETKASTGFNSSSATLGSLGLASDGTLTISTASKTFDISVSTGDTLQTVQQKIASGVYADTTTQTIAQASVINAGTSESPAYKLIVGSTEKGLDNAVSITGDAAVTSFFNFTQSQAAANASLTVNGVTIQRSSNTIDDIIDGVTIEALATGTSTLTIGRDTEAIKSKVSAMTNAYNQVVTTIEGMRAKGAVLSGDNTLSTLIGQIQSAFNSENTISGSSYRWLSEIGISFQKDGKLAIGSEFETALNDKFTDVVNLFTDSTSGKAKLIHDQTYSWLTTGGLLSSRTDGLNARISSLDTRMEQMQTRLINVEARLRRQFSALDSIVGTLQQTSAYLTKQLG